MSVPKGRAAAYGVLVVIAGVSILAALYSAATGEYVGALAHAIAASVAVIVALIARDPDRARGSWFLLLCFVAAVLSMGVLAWFNRG